MAETVPRRGGEHSRRTATFRETLLPDSGAAIAALVVLEQRRSAARLSERCGRLSAPFADQLEVAQSQACGSEVGRRPDRCQAGLDGLTSA